MPRQMGIMSSYQLSAHTHSGVGQGGVVPLGNIAGHTKAVHDALAINADQVDGIDLPNTIANILSNHTKALHDALKIDSGYLGASVELTINGGIITATTNFHSIDGEGDLADNLDTIAGGVHGQLLAIRAENPGRPITVTQADNIDLNVAGNFVMNNVNDILFLLYDAVWGQWHEISRSDNV